MPFSFWRCIVAADCIKIESGLDLIVEKITLDGEFDHILWKTLISWLGTDELAVAIAETGLELLVALPADDKLSAGRFEVFLRVDCATKKSARNWNQGSYNTLLESGLLWAHNGGSNGVLYSKSNNKNLQTTHAPPPDTSFYTLYEGGISVQQGMVRENFSFDDGSILSEIFFFDNWNFSVEDSLKVIKTSGGEKHLYPGER